ncbi:MAG: type II toxin-antitoxin system HicA family toxin [Bacteroidales bacterium]|nr:type II toxin-antitoxin system HicA family toxin [Bacteroidales bacterium]
MSAKEVITILKNNGWEFLRQRGSHILYQRNGMVCPIPNHRVLARGTLKSIEKIVNLAEGKTSNEKFNTHI